MELFQRNLKTTGQVNQLEVFELVYSYFAIDYARAYARIHLIGLILLLGLRLLIIRIEESLYQFEKSQLQVFEYSLYSQSITQNIIINQKFFMKIIVFCLYFQIFISKKNIPRALESQQYNDCKANLGEFKIDQLFDNQRQLQIRKERMVINAKQYLIILVVIWLSNSCQSYQYQVGETCCHDWRPGCAACASSQWRCSSCPSGYCVQNNDCDTSCISKMSQCSTCSSCSSCLTCSSNNYAINSSRCVLCSTLLTNCVTCSSSTVCTSCINNSYAINSTTCATCSSLLSNCTQCSSSTICTTCINNYFALSSGRCATCSSLLTACSQCSSSSVCINCANNTYTLNASTCVICSSAIIGCLQCNSPTLCTLCNNANQLFDNNTNRCGTCSFFMDGCSACNSSIVCTTCVNNSYIFNSSTNRCSTCNSLMDACLTCSSSTVCSSCTNSTLTVSNSTSKCVLCSSLLTNCSTCSSVSVCTACVDSFVLNSSLCKACSDLMTDCVNCSSATVCTKCANDSLAINSSQCVSCSLLMTSCTNCNSSNVCIACVNNTLAINSTNNQCESCQNLMESCVNCTSQDVCTACINNTFYINATTNKCQICSHSMIACLSCDSSTICRSCISNTYTININSSRCVSCSTFLDLCTSCSNSTVCLGCEVSPNIVLANQKCSYCINIIPNCLNCTNANKCTLCKKYYIINQLANSASCILCNNVMAGCIQCTSKTVCIVCSYGQIVVNGCSSVPGCTAVVQKQGSSLCIACNSVYYFQQSINGTCTCRKGHKAGQYCTEIIGCTNVMQTKKGDICSVCNKYSHFLLQNGTCVCQEGYQLKGQTCADICGDGKALLVPCDDGNLVDGDGCSSTCQIQQSYICKIITVSSPSKCMYKGWIKIDLNCINKLQNNTAQIILTFNPFVSNLIRSNFNNLVKLNSDKNCSIDYFTINGSEVHLFISYLQDIQGSNANITISYDPAYIISPNYTLPIQFVQCNGDRLVYEPNADKSSKETILFIVKIYSIAFLLVFIAGSFSYKMIGVQTLHTIHLIFISQAFASRYSPVVITFNQLVNTLNLYKQLFTAGQKISIRPYSRLQYCSDFISNNINIIVVSLLILVLFLLLIIGQKVFQRLKNQNKQTKKLVKVRKYRQILYNFLVFPIFIGFYLNFTISLIIQSNSQFQKLMKNNYLQEMSILFVTITTILILFYQWKQLLVQYCSKPSIHKKWYIPLYLTNITVLSAIIIISIFSYIRKPLYCLSAVSLVYTVALIIGQPYKDLLHNFSLTVNQFGIIINLAWMVSDEFVYLKREKDQQIAFCLLGWMLLILILAVVRAIRQFRKNGSSKLIQQKRKANKQLSQENKEDVLDQLLKETSTNINKYRIKSQSAHERQLQILAYKRMKNWKLSFLKSKLRYKQYVANFQKENEHKISYKEKKLMIQ